GCSSSASPLINGFTEAHAELLETLKSWCGFTHGMLWNTGYAANQAVLSQLPQRGDIVLADRLIHNSMISGLLASGARVIRYRHLDLEHLGSLLEEYQERTVFVVTESVFSMDGDYPDLQHMAALKHKHGFVWIVDEAHALGWYGERGSGLCEHFGVGDQVDVYVGTLGKALGSAGAYTLFHDETLARYLINHAGEFIYSTFFSPSAAAAARAAVSLIQSSHEQRKHLQHLSSRLRGLIASAPPGDSPIVPLRVDDPVSLAVQLGLAGIHVGAVRPPTVPTGEGRLRLSLHAGLSEADTDHVAHLLKELLQ
ncbi:MAG: aminotransferase class I/II-fold pyridoxal phosphate-dependent enzyme, partial [Verrucomicrobiota bacterium]